MPAALALGTDSSCAIPALKLFAVDPADSFLKDIDAGTFTIKAPDGSTVAGPTAIDTADCPVGHRLGTGRYVAPFTTPSTPKGVYTVEWSFTFVSGGPSYTQTQSFEVLGTVGNPLARTYTTVEAMRAAGIKPTKIKAGALRDLIVLASAYVDMFTGRFFEATAKTVKVDGTGARGLLLNEPIVAVAGASILIETFQPSDSVVSQNGYRVYNRHLSQGLLDPDDRDNPKLEFFFHSDVDIPSGSVTFLDDFVWTIGRQNIKVEGVFGFTEPPGPIGTTPPLIEHATKLLVLRNAPALTDGDKRADALNAWRIMELRTRDQQIKYGLPVSGSAAIGSFTGDPEIDTILSRYTRPVQLGAA